MALSFAFDANAGETPQTIAQRRQISNLIAARMLGTAPKNVGEGLNAIGQALIARSMMGDADAAQKAGEASLPDFLKPAGSPSSGIASAIMGQPSVSTPMGATSIPAGNDEFVNTVMPLAQQASEKTGIDPRLITAQAALESGYGKHAPGNNLFGIKSHGQPGGNVLPTTEIVNGQPVRTTDSFMSYASPADSVNGYADFINNNPRYAPLKAAHGLEAQAAALGQSGYATDPNYGQKVLKIAQGLPAPTGGVLADNSPSPLDNAQYPAGPVGAPQPLAGASPADTGGGGGAALPANSQPAQFVVPGTQQPAGTPAAVAAPVAAAIPQTAQQPATLPKSTGPFANVSDADIAKGILNPFTPEYARPALLAEYKFRQDAAQKAADPMRALDMQSKTLAIKKAQQDLNDRKTVVVNGRLVDAQTGDVVKDYSTIGKTPEGSVLETDAQGNPTGLRILANSPQDIKNKANQQKIDQQKEQQNRSADVVTQDIDRALDLTKNATLPVTGSIGALTANLPGTTSHDVSALLTGIKANISFDRLQAMRAASPTGGALGNVSDQEGARLASAYGNLEQSQSRQQFERNLKRVKNIYLDIVHGPGNGPARENIDGGKSGETQGPQPGLVKGGYRFKGGNPADPASWEKV